MLIDYITIGEQRHPVSFNMAALTFWADKIGVNVENALDSDFEITGYQALWLYYAGILHGYEGKQRRCTMSMGELTEKLSTEPEVAKELMNIFVKHMRGLAEVMGVVEEEEAVTDSPDKGQKKKRKSNAL